MDGCGIASATSSSPAFKPGFLFILALLPIPSADGKFHKHKTMVKRAESHDSLSWLGLNGPKRPVESHVGEMGRVFGAYGALQWIQHPARSHRTSNMT